MPDVSTLSRYQALARKRSASGALFVEDGKLLIVKPTYKEHWGIPGGVVDALESPRAACLRECKEELGLDVQLTHMAVIDWMEEPLEGAHDSFQIVFMGVPLTAEQKTQITLPADELADWAYVPIEEALSMLSEGVAKRVKMALEHADLGAAVYCENGVRV